MTRTLDTVLDWAGEVRSQIDAFDVPRLIHPVTLLALIHVESAGDPQAYREGSQFRGLLQIGRAYLQDAAEWLSHPMRDQVALHGDGSTSIAMTLSYLCRYAEYHQWHSTLIATIHKGGVGTCKMVRDEVVAGAPIHGALNYAESSLNVPRLREYVRRFETARSAYGEEMISAKRPAICAAMGLP